MLAKDLYSLIICFVFVLMQVLTIDPNNLKSHVCAPSMLSTCEAMKLSRAKRKASLLTAEQLKALNKEKSTTKRNQRKNAKAKLSEEELKQLNKEKSNKEKIRNENAKAKLSEEQLKRLNKEKSVTKRIQRECKGQVV